MSPACPCGGLPGRHKPNCGLYIPPAPWPFGNLQMFKFGAIIADPPWSFDHYSEAGQTEKSAAGQYDLMSDGGIAGLPVDKLATRDCLLFLWATWPRIDFALSVLEAWQFRYITGGAWAKRTKNGKLQIGTGYSLRNACDPFLIGRMGDNQSDARDIPNLIEAEAREHSRKPDEARRMVERMTPHAFRVELFAREPWPENDVWGNEVDKFT